MSPSSDSEEEYVDDIIKLVGGFNTVETDDSVKPQEHKICKACTIDVVDCLKFPRYYKNQVSGKSKKNINDVIVLDDYEDYCIAQVSETSRKKNKAKHILLQCKGPECKDTVSEEKTVPAEKKDYQQKEGVNEVNKTFLESKDTESTDSWEIGGTSTEMSVTKRKIRPVNIANYHLVLKKLPLSDQKQASSQKLDPKQISSSNHKTDLQLPIVQQESSHLQSPDCKPTNYPKQKADLPLPDPKQVSVPIHKANIRWPDPKSVPKIDFKKNIGLIGLKIVDRTKQIIKPDVCNDEAKNNKEKNDEKLNDTKVFKKTEASKDVSLIGLKIVDRTKPIIRPAVCNNEAKNNKEKNDEKSNDTKDFKKTEESKYIGNEKLETNSVNNKSDVRKKEDIVKRQTKELVKSDKNQQQLNGIHKNTCPKHKSDSDDRNKKISQTCLSTKKSTNISTTVKKKLLNDLHLTSDEEDDFILHAKSKKRKGHYEKTKTCKNNKLKEKNKSRKKKSSFLSSRNKISFEQEKIYNKKNDAMSPKQNNIETRLAKNPEKTYKDVYDGLKKIFNNTQDMKPAGKEATPSNAKIELETSKDIKMPDSNAPLRYYYENCIENSQNRETSLNPADLTEKMPIQAHIVIKYVENNSPGPQVSTKFVPSHLASSSPSISSQVNQQQMSNLPGTENSPPLFYKPTVNDSTITTDAAVIKSPEMFTVDVIISPQKHVKNISDGSNNNKLTDFNLKTFPNDITASPNLDNTTQLSMPIRLDYNPCDSRTPKHQNNDIKCHNQNKVTEKHKPATNTNYHQEVKPKNSEELSSKYKQQTQHSMNISAMGNYVNSSALSGGNCNNQLQNNTCGMIDHQPVMNKHRNGTVENVQKANANLSTQPGRNYMPNYPLLPPQSHGSRHSFMSPNSTAMQRPPPPYSAMSQNTPGRFNSNYMPRNMQPNPFMPQNMPTPQMQSNMNMSQYSTHMPQKMHMAPNTTFKPQNRPMSQNSTYVPQNMHAPQSTNIKIRMPEYYKAGPPTLSYEQNGSRNTQPKKATATPSNDTLMPASSMMLFSRRKPNTSMHEPNKTPAYMSTMSSSSCSQMNNSSMSSYTPANMNYKMPPQYTEPNWTKISQTHTVHCAPLYDKPPQNCPAGADKYYNQILVENAPWNTNNTNNVKPFLPTQSFPYTLPLPPQTPQPLPQTPQPLPPAYPPLPPLSPSPPPPPPPTSLPPSPAISANMTSPKVPNIYPSANMTSPKIPTPRITSPVVESTIIGRSSDGGLIRKILIAKPPQSSPKLSSPSHQSATTPATNPVTSSPIILSKSEMMQELSNITDVDDIEMPLTKPTKRHADHSEDNIFTETTFMKRYKTDPNKLSVSPPPPPPAMVQNKGYSPPILPIPSHQKTIELLSQGQRRLTTIMEKENFHELEKMPKVKNPHEHEKIPNVKNSHELEKMPSIQSSHELEKMPVVKTEIKCEVKSEIKSECVSPRQHEVRQSTESDHGYDSDSTVKL